jgi:23S rRNA (guanosine2251-2'-O)-methyltransferase
LKVWQNDPEGKEQADMQNDQKENEQLDMQNDQEGNEQLDMQNDQEGNDQLKKMNEKSDKGVQIIKINNIDIGKLIYGRHAVTEAIRSGSGIEKILLQKNIEGEGKKFFALAKKAKIPLQTVPKFVLDRECCGGAHQGVAAIISDYIYSDIDSILDAAASAGELPFIVALDGIEDTGNLGAIIRSAEGAGAHGVLIPKQRSASVNATVMKTSAGAAVYMKVAKVPGIKAALDELKEKGLWIYGLDVDGDPYMDAKFDGGVCLVIGSEGSGLSRIVRETCDFLVAVPMKGRIKSLNASAAAAVVLFQVSSKWRK